MSGRWPASILSQAYPRKTTASLSSTNSKSLVFAFRMPLGSIFELYSMLLQVLMCRQHTTSLCLATLSMQHCLFKVSSMQCFVCSLSLEMRTYVCMQMSLLDFLSTHLISCMIGLLFSKSVKPGLVILIQRTGDERAIVCIHQLVGMQWFTFPLFDLVFMTFSVVISNICPPNSVTSMWSSTLFSAQQSSRLPTWLGDASHLELSLQGEWLYESVRTNVVRFFPLPIFSFTHLFSSLIPPMGHWWWGVDKVRYSVQRFAGCTRHKKKNRADL